MIALSTAALLGAFSPPPTTFSAVFHVYDPSKGTPPSSVPDTALIGNVLITVTGPKNFSAPTPSGILSPNDPLPEGTYQIVATKTGYSAPPVTYVMSSTCNNRDQFGICHVWIAMSPSQ